MDSLMQKITSLTFGDVFTTVSIICLLIIVFMNTKTLITLSDFFTRTNKVQGEFNTAVVTSQITTNQLTVATYADLNRKIELLQAELVLLTHMAGSSSCSCVRPKNNRIN